MKQSLNIRIRRLVGKVEVERLSVNFAKDTAFEGDELACLRIQTIGRAEASHPPRRKHARHHERDQAQLSSPRLEEVAHFYFSRNAINTPNEIIERNRVAPRLTRRVRSTLNHHRPSVADRR